MTKQITCKFEWHGEIEYLVFYLIDKAIASISSERHGPAITFEIRILYKDGKIRRFRTYIADLEDAITIAQHKICEEYKQVSFTEMA